MENNYLKKRIEEIEEKFFPILEVLENNPHYKELYKGIITIQSKISQNPDILFLGINPGQGAFLKKNHRKGDTHYFPKILTSNNDSPILDWFIENNARNGNWYEKDKKVKNSFPARMLEILFVIAQNKFKHKIDLAQEKHRGRIVNELTENIMFTNFCPIATESITTLEKIYSKLAGEESLKSHWKHNYTGEITKKEVKNFFRQRTFDLIKILNPKVIVFLGNTVYKELTYENVTGKYNTTKLSFTRDDNRFEYDAVIFSRKGNWQPNIIRIGEEITSFL